MFVCYCQELFYIISKYEWNTLLEKVIMKKKSESLKIEEVEKQNNT